MKFLSPRYLLRYVVKFRMSTKFISYFVNIESIKAGNSQMSVLILLHPTATWNIWAVASRKIFKYLELNYVKSLTQFLILAMSLFSCTEVVEPNITNLEVEIIAPSNEFTTRNSSVVFWWNPMQGARNYELQIVSPSFDNLNSIAADTVMVGSKFVISLVKGKYEWRIRATNAGYRSQLTVRSFEVM